MRARCWRWPFVDRIPNPCLAGSGRHRVRLPQVRSAHGVRVEERVRVGCRHVDEYDIDNR